MATREGSFSVEDMKNVQINIGAVVKEAEEWDQEMGPCPKPGVATLRKWDHSTRKQIQDHVRAQPMIPAPCALMVRVTLQVTSAEHAALIRPVPAARSF